MNSTYHSRSGEHHWNWQGGRSKCNGYIEVYAPEHPAANRGRVYEHRLIAEETLGRSLPAGVLVHHADGDRANNRRTNLVVCPDDGYHQLLHLRFRVVAAGGNPNTDKFCKRCNEAKHRSQFNRYRKVQDGLQPRCRACQQELFTLYTQARRPSE